MNQRIKDLSLKAAYQCDLDDPKFLQKYTEKFAELIVKECSAYVEGTGNWLVAMEMKQHFGVEE